jgi:hypothetical protein
MNNFQDKASFIWSVADLLRGDFKQYEYQKVIQTAKVNDLDNFKLPTSKMVEDAMLDRMDKNQDIVTRFLNNTEFGEVLRNYIMERVYREVRRESSL